MLSPTSTTGWPRKTSAPNPSPKQLAKLKSQKMAEMKLAGIEYDERIEELEKLECPKPNREFIYSTFNAFADKHPWVGQENIRPKSTARERFETSPPSSDSTRA